MIADKDELSLKDLLRYIWEHILLIVLTVLAGGVCFYMAASFIMKPQYVSDIKFSVYTRPAEQVGPVGSIQADTLLVQDYAVVIRSRTVAQAVIKELQLMKDGQPMAPADLMEKVVVDPGDGTSRMITVSIVHEDPFLAADIADEYAEAAIQTIKDSYGVNNISIVDHANVPLERYSPNTFLFVLLGIILGLACGCLILTLLYMIEDDKTIFRFMAGAAALLLVVFVAISGILYARSDRKGPEITFNSDHPLYDGLNTTLLLTDVTAVDETDGDVSDTLRIKSLMETEDEILVIYMAKDQSSNITEKSRHIQKNE